MSVTGDPPYPYPWSFPAPTLLHWPAPKEYMPVYLPKPGLGEVVVATLDWNGNLTIKTKPHEGA